MRDKENDRNYYCVENIQKLFVLSTSSVKVEHEELEMFKINTFH